MSDFPIQQHNQEASTTYALYSYMGKEEEFSSLKDARAALQEQGEGFIVKTRRVDITLIEHTHVQGKI